VVTNDAVCVLLAPLVVKWIRRDKLPRLPLLAALATGANTGSVATLVGNPQNILCGSLGKLHVAPFLLHLLPVAIVALTINHAILLLIFRKDLEGSLPEEPSPPALMTVRSAITLGVILATVGIYTAGGSLAFTALGGFAVLLVVHRRDPATVWERIDCRCWCSSARSSWRSTRWRGAERRSGRSRASRWWARSPASQSGCALRSCSSSAATW